MNSGGGGYAAKWYGYCNGQAQDGSEGCPQNQWSLPGEHENGLKHNTGSLAAAHAGLNTDGSQFYIVPTGSQPTWLDWEEGKNCAQASCHTVYGTVTDGQEHIDAIAEVPTIGTGQNKDKPVNDVTIVSVTITDDGIKDSTPWYQFW